MKNKIKLISSIFIAGKLATAPHLASAGGLGKNSSNSGEESLSLDQIGYPLTILTPPIDTNKILATEDQGSKLTSSDSGTLFSGKSYNTTGQQSRIDFIINNIQGNKNPVVVFLAYSLTKGDPSQWQDLQLNNFFLDRKTFKIISSIQVKSSNQPFNQQFNTSTPLGSTTNQETNSVIVSLDLGDLNHLDFIDNNIYFQVITFPLINGELDFSAAKTSELDHYIISREEKYQTKSNSKIDEQGNDDKLKSCLPTPNTSGSKIDEQTAAQNNDSGSKGGSSNARDTGGK